MDDVEGGSTHVLFGPVVVVSPTDDPSLLELLLFAHFVISTVISPEPLVPQIINFGLPGFKSFLSDSLVSDVEIFIEPLSLRNELG